MRPLDWVVFFAWLISLVSYGLYRGRGSNTVTKYLLAGKSMPWYAMGLSILATQASAITFISTTGQGFVDGMRFVQFYFGLPLAMVILSATAVPIFHRAKVYTAYEYLENRFDPKTRALVSLVFLIQRGLAAGIGLYAPAVALAGVLGWSDRLITVIIGTLVVLYTATGGIKALTWADVQQMTMIFIALVVSLTMILHALPAQISFNHALHLAGAAGRLNIVDLRWDLSDRYNLWSGLIGGCFLALAYFGCDQSQVQRYLTGRSVAQSRLSLLFNATVKVPMQLFILFIGAMAFVLSLFVPQPMVFQPREAEHFAQTAEWKQAEANYNRAFEARRAAAFDFAQHRDPGSTAAFRRAQASFSQTRQAALKLVAREHHASNYDDTNYIFLSFVKQYLPIGLVGLVIGVIFSASMGSTSGEINSLATVSVVDIYRRFLVRNRPDRLGSLRGGLCRTRRARLRCAHRTGQYRRFALLWRAARRVRARLLLQMGRRHRRFHRSTRGRSGDLRGRRVHQHLVPLVQRDRLPGGRRGRATVFPRCASPHRCSHSLSNKSLNRPG